jgi:hypothetical protein
MTRDMSGVTEKNKINVRILLKNIYFIHNAVKIPKFAVERIANE